MKRIFPLIFLFALVGLVPVTEAEDLRSPTVGAAGHIDQLVLPGPELVGKPLVEGDPIVVRIVDVFPHGDSFRYDIRFHGMEPGKYDLVKWLVRKDGSEVGELPEIPIEIISLLPPGQIQPNELESGWLPRLGGYRNLLIAAVVLWLLVLLSLIFLGRKKPEPAAEPEHQLTLADLLQTRIEAALANRMEPKQYAELERMLFAFWRKRLNLEDQATAVALVTIKQNDEAGPLMNQLERWLHSPHPSKDVNLAELLKPFQNLPADTPGFES